MPPEPIKEGPGSDPPVGEASPHAETPTRPRQEPQPSGGAAGQGAAPGEKENPGKEALTTAADFIKYSVALATGTLVFSAGLVLEDISLSTAAKVLIFISWFALAASTVAGVLAFSRIPIQLAERNYDLEDRYFIVPGRIHQVSFVVGILTLGLALMLTLWFKGEAGAAPVTPSPAVLSATQERVVDTPAPAVTAEPTVDAISTPVPAAPD